MGLLFMILPDEDEPFDATERTGPLAISPGVASADVRGRGVFAAAA
jgi:hypothetical protein